ncbi:uncharacterized protein LOC127786198 [Oryza glaberrima]|uniref:uncharacterized protein LOC127786198 n=1 Tax=Oryza glaberrima TaxID=4538 RepID=UPI00224C616E|nr:uncharacterized protein LOC127786198 [Oryza glaberrima]
MSPVSPPLPRCSSLLMGMGGSGMGSSLEDVPLCRCWCDPRRPRTNGIDGDRFVQHRLLVSTIVPGLVVALARQGGNQMQTVNLAKLPPAGRGQHAVVCPAGLDHLLTASIVTARKRDAPSLVTAVAMLLVPGRTPNPWSSLSEAGFVSHHHRRSFSIACS